MTKLWSSFQRNFQRTMTPRSSYEVEPEIQNLKSNSRKSQGLSLPNRATPSQGRQTEDDKCYQNETLPKIKARRTAQKLAQK